ncbi:MAG: aminotransferase class V-fold PLP-dependent enzyme [Pyrinomonadaceae bacterium MAG19_C2-C3]|nr:aminotransferase class V-fold PLP-dependent enzyme [Pyrinomonadaceae bacterium MAG19_C2-C3]
MLLLDDKNRAELWQTLTAEVENHLQQVEKLAVAPKTNVAEIRSRLAPIDFEKPLAPLFALDFAVKNLTEFQVHTTHPRYFGLFNPAPTAMSIAADTLVAAFNPQLAAWSHSPFAAEVERHLIRAFAVRFGYDEATADGTFCSGGAEANHTALVAALVHHFPMFESEGLRGLKKQPVFYVSPESHHSFIKAARFCGLGTNYVREIETDESFRMSLDNLTEQIKRDREGGFAPFFVVATAGTTNGGTIDNLTETADIAARENLWFHVDAAWGGAAVFVPELKTALDKIERADSITFDAHKWLSVPMGAGIFLTRHAEILSRACRVATDYMPRDAGSFGVTDSFVHSMQWSRRFIGLKVFLSLMVAGWEGYAEAIRHQTAMGEYLRRELEKNDWEIVNQTPLPVVCFRDRKFLESNQGDYLNAIAAELVSSGEAWISTTRMSGTVPVLRACITNYRTQEKDVKHLVAILCQAREYFSPTVSTVCPATAYSSLIR